MLLSFPTILIQLPVLYISQYSWNYTLIIKVKSERATHYLRAKTHSSPHTFSLSKLLYERRPKPYALIPSVILDWSLMLGITGAIPTNLQMALKCPSTWTCSWHLNLRNWKLVRRNNWCNWLLTGARSSNTSTLN